MPSFYKYLMRHGEGWIMNVIECIERNEGITANNNLTLEERWDALHKANPTMQSLAA